MNRRDFLKCAGAAASAPIVVPGRVLGRDGGVAPSNRITLAQIGFGWIGGSHLNGFLHNDRVQFIAACDCFEERRLMAQQRIDDKFGGKVCKAYRDFRVMLERSDLDAVVIAVPDHWHAIMAVTAAEAGKDIYCEKPMSLTIHEGRAMVNAVRRYDRVFQTGSQQRSEYGGHFIRAAEFTRSGRIGEVKTIHIGVGGPPRPYDMPPEPIPEGLDWDLWLGQVPKLPYNSICCPDVNWRAFQEFCGGGFADMGAHHFDIAQWAMDCDHSGPVEIFPPDGEDVERLTLRYANGVEMIHGGGVDCDIQGTEGRIMAARGYLKAEPASLLKEPLGPGDVHLNRNRGHRDDWLDCIHSRGRPVADVEVGHRTATVCHLGNIAFRLRRPLQWDPDEEHFVKDEEANRFLTRPKRSPWRV